MADHDARFELQDSRSEMRDAVSIPLGSVTNESESVDNRYCNWLVVELGFLLNKLPEHLKQSTLSEVEEHLECSRLALAEVGVPAHEIDHEAAKRFGPPEEFARRVLNANKHVITPRRHLAWFGAVLMFFIYAFPAFMYYNGRALMWGLYVGIPIFIALSWRDRVFQWKRLLVTGAALGAVLFVYTGFAWVNTADVGGKGQIARWAINDYRASVQESETLIPKALQSCDPILATFDKGEVAVKASPYFEGGNFQAFEALWSQSGPWTPTYDLTWTDNFATAQQSWQEYRYERRRWQENLEDAHAQIPALDRASRKIFDPVTGWFAVLGVVTMTCILVLSNFLISVIRTAFDSIQRKPRRRLA